MTTIDASREFRFYICPECNDRSRNREQFLKHAFETHPEAESQLQKLQIKEEFVEDQSTPGSASKNHDDEATNTNTDPWDVKNLEEYLFFCCPECDDIDHDKLTFIQHAFGAHPHANHLHTIFLEMMRVNRSPAYPFGRQDWSKKGGRPRKNTQKPAYCPKPVPKKLQEEQIIIKQEVIEENEGPVFDNNFQVPIDTSSPVKIEPNVAYLAETSMEIPDDDDDDNEEETNIPTSSPVKIEVFQNDFGVEPPLDVSHDMKHLFEDDYPMPPPPTLQHQIKYKCESCDDMFTDFKAMQRHMRQHHGFGYDPADETFDHEGLDNNDPEFEPVKKVAKRGKPKGSQSVSPGKSSQSISCVSEMCDFCGKKFKTKSSLKKHYIDAHDGLGVNNEEPENAESFQCDQCEKTFPEAHNLKIHIRRVHEATRDHVCKVCQKAFASAFKLNHHIRVVHEGEKNHVCSICGKAFGTGSDMRKHVRKVHEKKKEFQCEHCDFGCNNRKTLVNHWKKEHDLDEEINYKCESCEKGFKTLDGLTIHAKLVHEGVKEEKDPTPKVYQCDSCVKTFDANHKLQAHIRKDHQGIFDYPCQQCGKGYTSVAGLQHHVKTIHEGIVIKQPSKAGIRNYHCDQCPKSYSQKEGLENHIKRFHEGDFEKTVFCDQCDKSFLNKASLKAHIKVIHDKKLDFRCEYCGKEFAFKVHLNGHIKRVHETENNEKCPHCNKTFAFKYDMDIHVKSVHEGYKPHQCQECGKSFGKSNTLNDHIKRVHQAKKNEECRYCNQSYLYKSELQRHVETVHAKTLRMGLDLSLV